MDCKMIPNTTCLLVGMANTGLKVINVDKYYNNLITDGFAKNRLK